MLNSSNTTTTRRKSLKTLGGWFLGAVATGAALAGSQPARLAQAATINFGTPGISLVGQSPTGFVYGVAPSGTNIGMFATTEDLAKLADYMLDHFGALPTWEATSGNGGGGGIGILGYGKRPIYALTSRKEYSVGVEALARGVSTIGVKVRATTDDTKPSNQYVTGVYAIAESGNSTGVYVNASGANAFGVYAYASGVGSKAGVFSGAVDVQGNLTKAGGTFRIDHPLDPENKYLSHSFVESPERKNIYDGVVNLDERGEAVVELPGYFETLNTNFRYQLTALGQAAPDLHVAQEVKAGWFKIAGGKAGQQICWQVTGTRQDQWAKTNQLVVEEVKPADEKGFYLHPEAFGQPHEKGLHQAREQQKQQALKQVATQK